MMMRRFAACLLLAVALTACAPPLPVGQMVPDKDVVQSIEPNPAFNRKIALGQISVVENVQHDNVGPVTPEVLRKTLDDTLFGAHLLGHEETIQKNASPYLLDADLTQLDTSSASLGFSHDAWSAIDYTLTRRADGAVLYHDNIRQNAHTGWMEAPDATENARMTMAHAVKENVTHLLRVLATIEAPAAKRPSLSQKVSP